jgi:hypothetical protein
LTNVTLPPDLAALTSLFVNGNPLATFVLSEPEAATSLAGLVASLRNRGVSVHTYPLVVSLLSPHRLVTGNLAFTLTGPPGAYDVEGSTDLAAWSDVGTATNSLGSVTFTDAAAFPVSLRRNSTVRAPSPR